MRKKVSIDVHKKAMGLLDGVPSTEKVRKARAMSIDAVREARPELVAVKHEVTPPQKKRRMSIDDARVIVGYSKPAATAVAEEPEGPPPAPKAPRVSTKKFRKRK